MEKRLDDHEFAFTHKHIAFEYIGHVMTDKISPVYRLAFKDERRYKHECAEERTKLVSEIIDWTENVW